MWVIASSNVLVNTSFLSPNNIFISCAVGQFDNYSFGDIKSVNLPCQLPPVQLIVTLSWGPDKGGFFYLSLIATESVSICLLPCVWKNFVLTSSYVPCYFSLQTCTDLSILYEVSWYVYYRKKKASWMSGLVRAEGGNWQKTDILLPKKNRTVHWK